MPPPTELASSRLCLTPPAVKDIPQLLLLLNDTLVAEMTLSIPFPFRENDAVAWLHSVSERRQVGTAYVFAIREADSAGLIGAIGVHLHPLYGSAELGYWIGAPYRGRGFATEAIGAVIDFAFEHLGVVRVQAMHKYSNHPSGKAMRANGMRQEAELEDYVVKHGVPQTVIQYRILRREWAAARTGG